jgi:hypothetical protein
VLSSLVLTYVRGVAIMKRFRSVAGARSWVLLLTTVALLSALGDRPIADVRDSTADWLAGDSSATVAVPSLLSMPVPKSAKRGIAYDLADSRDFGALSPGVSWWYNWSPKPNGRAPRDAPDQYGMDFYPMLWGSGDDAAAIESYLRAHPRIKYLLALNEPNITAEANLTPEQAAELWPRIEEIAQRTGVEIVGPAMTWGTMQGYADPVVWLDAFNAAYAARHKRSPRIDYLAFHWYDYGLALQLDRLRKFGKRFWVTEFANWHSQIETPEQQARQMEDMVSICESRDDVARYAWFIGRWNPDPHYTSLLGTPGQLTRVGQLYLSLPYSSP